MFAYCCNNPTIRTDVSGLFWDVVVDIISVGYSLINVIKNHKDTSAWLSLGADIGSLFVPFLTGGGTAVRLASKADDVIDVMQSADRITDVTVTTKKGWQVGDDITNLTKAGNTPSWSTVRQRYWKNEAYFNPQNYSDSDLVLMKKGRAPLVERNGMFYPMELHHKQPRHKGGSNAYDNLLPVTPWDHAIIDTYRHFKP